MDAREDGLSSYKIVQYAGKDIPQAYRAMVFSKWLRSLRSGNDYFKLIASSAYYGVYHSFIESILNREQAILKFAVLIEDPDVVLGWAAMEPGKLHYCFVNTESRRLGVATALCSDPVFSITHLTKIGMAIWNSKLKSAVFNPFE